VNDAETAAALGAAMIADPHGVGGDRADRAVFAAQIRAAFPPSADRWNALDRAIENLKQRRG
jgi:hypothetical protein